MNEPVLTKTDSPEGVDEDTHAPHNASTEGPEVCSCYEMLHHNAPCTTGTTRPLLGCEHPTCPYRYLKRDTFTSEAFKIQLRNLHRHAGFKELKKLLEGLQVKYRKLKLLRDVSFVTFGSEEDRDAALKVLDGHVWRGRKMEARVALGRADPLLQKRIPATTADDGSSDRKRACLASSTGETDELDEGSRLRDTVTPLWRLQYDPDQLNAKRSSVLSSLAIIRSKILSCNPSLKIHLPRTEKVEELRQIPVCPLTEVIASPVIEDYRNKSELTIGCDLDGKGPLIGFRFTKYRDGLTAVGSYRHLSILPPATVAVVDSLQQFIDQYSPLEPQSKLITYDPITHQGHWRQVLVRETRLADRLLLVDLHPQTMDEETLSHLSEALRRWFFNDGPGVLVKLTSLYLSTRKSTSEKFDSSNTRLLEGKDHIVELCCNLKFRISLDAFFQVNTLACELLYQQIVQLVTSPTDASDQADINSSKKREHVLLDVCCGTGTIGLCMAKYFDRVIGIEMVPSAVADAKYNVSLNGVENIQFYTGKAEDVMRDVMNTLSEEAEITAVVDPPRAGLHTTVIQVLRRCSRLKRVLFVSCSLEAAMHNFVEFARPTSNRFQGSPFIPVLAKAVDLFPQTRHIEVLVLLERVLLANKE